MACCKKTFCNAAYCFYVAGILGLAKKLKNTL
jgi:hypothetical protein